MTVGQAGKILRYLRTPDDDETTGRLTDAALLQRFSACREEAAFVALVQRHGRLVWGVCQHLLHHEQDAEDAFQATFLVLARRAGSVRKTEALGSFLHRVAYRVAMKAKQSARKRQARERRAAGPSKVEPSSDLAWRELQAALDDEVAKLPQKYRGPFVLCCLEGRPRREVARELGCKEGTVSSRIARARQLLQQRLTRRGVSLSAALCAGILWNRSAGAEFPLTRSWRTVRAVTGPAGSASTAATMLAQGALKGMGLTRWQMGIVLILGLGLLGAGMGLLGPQVAAPPPGAKPIERPSPAVAARKDLHGDPLPPGALARLGTVRLRAPDSHLAVTADGKEIVAVGSDLSVRRFDARTGELRGIRQLPRASAPWLQTWLSPRGTFVLAWGIRRTGEHQLEVWDLAKGELRHTLSVSGQSIWGAAFSADERRVAVAHSSTHRPEHRVLLWDLETSRSRVVWSQTQDIGAQYFNPIVAFSPDGKRLVACHLDLTLRCWEVEGGKLLWQSEKRNWTPFVLFSPDGRTVVTPSGINTSGIAVRDAATGKLLEGHKPPPPEAVYPVGFSPDGRFLAFLTGQEEIVLWEPGKAKATFRFARPPHRRDTLHFSTNRLPTNFAFTPDSKGFIRRAGALQRWDLGSGKPVYADTNNWGHTEEVTRLLFSPDGRLLASSAKDQVVRLWNVSTARTAHDFPKGLSDHLAFTSDGRSLLSVPFGLGKTALQATDVATGRPGRGFELSDRREFMPGSRDKELRVTADGEKVLMLTWKNGRQGDESVLTAWNTTTGECLVHKRVPWGEDSLLTSDGRSVLTLDSGAQVVKLLAIDTGQQRWQLQSDHDPDRQQRTWGHELALSPDGRLMAARITFFTPSTSRMDVDAIRVGDMTNGRQLLKLATREPAVFAFSADSRLFVIAGPAEVRLWETTTWREVGSFPAPNRGSIPTDRACASSLAFSPDGRILATGHVDGTILLWDATLRGGTGGRPRTLARRQALWADLAGADAGRAYAAIWQLADDPGPSVSFLRERLRPVQAAPPELVRSLLDDLDCSRFPVREAAEQKLRELGERAGSALREALKAKPSLERRRRIEALLTSLETSGPLSGEPLRAVRVVQVLERIGSAEARRILEGLVTGVESARLTQAAKESLARLKQQ
jgi:RNA polymerase sigma factor (sigma-70 family)